LFSVLGVAWVDGLGVVVGLGFWISARWWVLGLPISEWWWVLDLSVVVGLVGLGVVVGLRFADLGVVGLGLLSWVLGLPISAWVGHGGLGVVASW
jgi:hypothetical protein